MSVFYGFKNLTGNPPCQVKIVNCPNMARFFRKRLHYCFMTLPDPEMSDSTAGFPL